MDETKLAGVYCIRNIINGKVYIGSAATSFRHRWNCHRSDLRLGKNRSTLLQRAWNKYGESSFEFTILIICEKHECIKHEQFFINKYDSSNPNIGYNISPTAGSSLGVKQSEETIKKISENTKKQYANPATRANIIAARKRRFDDPNERKKASELFRSILSRPGVKDKIIAARKLKFSNPLERQKHGEKIRDSLNNSVTKKKMSESAKRRPKFSDETRKKMSIASKAKAISPETRKKMAASATGKKRSIESRERMSKAYFAAQARKKLRLTKKQLILF